MSQCSLSSVPCMIGACLLLQAVCCAPAAADSPTTPEMVLMREFGLSRRGKSEVWTTPRERDLRERLTRLPKLVERTRETHSSIVEARERNRILWAQRQELEKALKKKASELSASDPQRKQLEESLKQLDAVAVAPEKLGGAPWVQPKLIDMTNARNAILLDVSAVRESAPAMTREYEALRENDDVAAALAMLGGGHRLGPLKDYAADLRRLTEYEDFAHQLPQPLYLQSGEMRLGAILNERMPVTFTWKNSSEPTAITTSVAQAAGVLPSQDASPETLGFPGGRRLEVRRITLASLRFGPHVLRDVEAFVLPPEGEDLGSQIGASAFQGFRVAPDPALLQFRIEPK